MANIATEQPVTLNVQITAPVEFSTVRGKTVTTQVRYKFTSEGWQRETDNGDGWIPDGTPTPDLPAFTPKSSTIFSNIPASDVTKDALLLETAEKLRQAIPSLQNLTLGVVETVTNSNGSFRRISFTSRMKAGQVLSRLDAMIARLSAVPVK